jgi:hypothetical protein
MYLHVYLVNRKLDCSTVVSGTRFLLEKFKIRGIIYMKLNSLNSKRLKKIDTKLDTRQIREYYSHI